MQEWFWGSPPHCLRASFSDLHFRGPQNETRPELEDPLLIIMFFFFTSGGCWNAELCKRDHYPDIQSIYETLLPHKSAVDPKFNSPTLCYNLLAQCHPRQAGIRNEHWGCQAARVRRESCVTLGVTFSWRSGTFCPDRENPLYLPCGRNARSRKGCH